METTNVTGLQQRCDEALEELGRARKAAPADIERFETRIDFSMRAFVALVDARPASSDAAAFAQRVLEAHLVEAEAFLDRTMSARALAAA